MFHLAETVIVGLTLNDLAERMHVENALQLHNFFLVVPLEQFLAPGQHGALCLELGETGERDHNEKTY